MGTTYIPTDLTGTSTIIEHVDCAFGRNHKIHIRLRKDNSIDYIGCTCGSNKERRREVEGMILLGTEPGRTCLGMMRHIIKEVTAVQSRYIEVSEKFFNLQNTSAHYMMSYMKSPIQAKQSKRASLKAEIRVLEEQESVVCRRLRGIMEKQIGYAATAFSFYQEDNNLYTFNIIQDPQKGRTRWDNQVGGYVSNALIQHEIGTRKEGVWHLSRDWEHHLSISRQSYGRCVICGVDGRSNHWGSQGHLRKTARAAFLTMQATSSEGLKMRNVLDENGRPHKFKYRKGSKNLVGVVY